MRGERHPLNMRIIRKGGKVVKVFGNKPKISTVLIYEREISNQ